MTKRYKHSKVFAELKSVDEDIKINLTSLQYLQILDHYLLTGLGYLMRISPSFFNNYVAKIVAYQQRHAMIKVSSESRESLSCAFFNYLTSNDKDQVRNMYLNRGLYFGIIAYWLQKSKQYFDCSSPFADESDCLEREKIKYDIVNELAIVKPSLYYAYYKQIQYWFNLAVDFKAKIVQKYTRLTLLQAQKTYVEYNHVMDLDDISQIYLQVMSKAIDRCDSRFGVLTTFIQSWLKSAKAVVQKTAQTENVNCSYDSLLEDRGGTIDLGSVELETYYDTIQQIAYILNMHDNTGCFRINFDIPEYLNKADEQLLLKYVQE